MDSVDGEDGQGDVEMVVLEIQRGTATFQFAAEIKIGLILAYTVFPQSANGAIHDVLGRTALVEKVAAEQDEVNSSLATYAQNLLECSQCVLAPHRVLAAETQVDVGGKENLEDVLGTSLRFRHDYLSSSSQRGGTAVWILCVNEAAKISRCGMDV